MPEPLLFIGGTLDGVRLTIHHTDRYVSAAREMYVKMLMAGEKATYSLFKLETLTPDEVMKALLEGYTVESQIKKERDVLAEGIAEAAITAGILNRGISLTGPQLLHLCHEMGYACRFPGRLPSDFVGDKIPRG